MISIVLSLLVAGSTLEILADSVKDFYTGAIFAHNPSFLSAKVNVTSRGEALAIMERNLDVLASQVDKAKTEGADIFVFPEYGITGLGFGLISTSYFVEPIPDPKTRPLFCPCTSGGNQVGQEALHRLSCIAKTNEIYLAVNMGDKQPCNNDCPIIGHYQYNTEVVFDRKGCLVAKYHKEHLFLMEKLKWDVPKSVDISYFDTEFGRFGLMICFDAVFKSPATDLVETYNVTDIIFSTAWMNVYPHYMSTAYHSGWARTMNVNYLSANIQRPRSRFVGSGIYGPDGVLNYTFNESTDIGQLVIARVPRNDRQAGNINYYTKSAEEIVEPVLNKDTFTSKIFDDDFSFTMLTGLAGNLTICSETVCCNLKFSRHDDTEFYALGVFNGMHYLEGEYYLEVCLLVLCSGYQKECGSLLPKSSDTVFTTYTMTGVMSTKYAFPEVVSPDLNFTTDWEFIDQGYTKSITGSNKKLASVVLMGRNFAKDPSSALEETNEVVPSCAKAVSVQLSLIIFVTFILLQCFSWFYI